MRSAGRLLRWRCVRRQSPRPPLRLRQDLTTAQDGTFMRITQSIIRQVTTPGDTMAAVITGTSRAGRGGNAA
jgi:hypothetical protein